MNDTTANLALPLLHAAQAQKEWTHNEALVRLDALVGGVLAGGPTTEPPSDTAEGSLWLVGDDPAGVWAGHGAQLAIASANGWRFLPAPVGFAVSRADGRPVRRTREGWSTGEGVFDRFDMGAARPVADPAGGGSIDVEARAALASLLGLLRDQGLVAPSA